MQSQIDQIKTQLDYLLTLDKTDDPAFFSAAVDRIHRQLDKLKRGELTKDTEVKLEPKDKAWPKLITDVVAPPMPPPTPKTKISEAPFDTSRCFLNFHSTTYHWLSDWMSQMFIAVKEGRVPIKLRVRNGKPEVNFKTAKSDESWYPILKEDQVVTCLDEDGKTHHMKFKWVRDIT